MHDDDEYEWQDKAFRQLRAVASVIAEYLPLIEDHNTPVGWTFADLRDVNHELLIALEDGDRDAAEPLLDESRLLLTMAIKLAF